jgi:hypothetical protein
VNARPYYCRPQDNANEEKVLNALTMRLNMDSVKFGQHRTWCSHLAGDRKHNPYDGKLFCNGKLFALVEIKCRNGESTLYADWHMSQSKIQRNMDAAKAAGVPLFLVYRWSDGIFLADAAKLDLSRTHVSGRWDRGDSRDEEVMVLMDSKSFKRV